MFAVLVCASVLNLVNPLLADSTFAKYLTVEPTDTLPAVELGLHPVVLKSTLPAMSADTTTYLFTYLVNLLEPTARSEKRGDGQLVLPLDSVSWVLGEVDALFHGGAVIIDYRAKQVSIIGPGSSGDQQTASAWVDETVDVEGGILVQLSYITPQGQVTGVMRIPKVRPPD
jgi:hypothetical protein